MFSAAAYRMVQQPSANAAAAAAAMYMGVPTVQAATNGAGGGQPPIVYTAMPQYQTQWAEVGGGGGGIGLGVVGGWGMSGAAASETNIDDNLRGLYDGTQIRLFTIWQDKVDGRLEYEWNWGR